MCITDLGGHSGCKILLIENATRNFVRKISSSKSYNERLIAQFKKQKNIYSCMSNFKVPEVFDYGYTKEKLFYFDMEYIHGITLAEYLKFLEVDKIRSLVSRIYKFIIPKEDNGQADPIIFTHKIESLRNKLKYCNNPIIKESLDLLYNHNWNRFKKSFCHGDLTLENIIVKDDELYIIDLLDSFYDCWILDISTILQDVQVLWSYRKDKYINNNLLIRLIVFRDVLMESIEELGSDLYLEVYYALLLKLIRIYPYTEDNLTYQFLNKKVESIIRIIKPGREEAYNFEKSNYSLCR